MMRGYCLAATFLAAACWDCAAADSFPYVGYVQVRNAAVRSGPGDSFYITDRIAWGSKVEVYRVDEQKWAAIRPPQASFAWVEAEALDSTNQQVRIKANTTLLPSISALSKTSCAALSPPDAA